MTKTRRMRWIQGLVLVAGLGAAACVNAQDAPNTSAQEAPDEEQLRTWIAEATRFAVEGEFDKALDLYFKARTYHDDPRLDYNIARCYQKLGKCTQAVRFYNDVLGNPAADLEDQKFARGYLQELGSCESEKSLQEIAVSSDAESQDASSGETNVAAWSTTLAGGALVLTGLALDLSGGSLVDDYEAAAAAGNGERYKDLKGQIENRQNLVYGLYGVGLATSLVGGVLFALEDDKKETSWRLSPMMGQDGEAGAWVSGRF